MIAIVDYGAGNLFSVKNALDYIGEESLVTGDPVELSRADGILLPGVGAFPDAMRMLKESGLIPVLREQANIKPLLGVCLGMQMLFERGYEFGVTEGLSLLPGRVVKMTPANDLPLPHIGWNRLLPKRECPLLAGLPSKPYMYFVHSYRVDCPPEVLDAATDYGGEAAAFVSQGMVFGAQFHPEKSSEAGLQILRNFGGLLR